MMKRIKGLPYFVAALLFLLAGLIYIGSKTTPQTAATTIAGSTRSESIKIATTIPHGAPQMRRLRDAAARIKEQTEDRINIKFYPGGIQGPDEYVLKKIKVGMLQGGMFTPQGFESVYPHLAMYTLPFLFESEEEAAYVREEMDSVFEYELEQTGFETFGFAGNGFSMLMSQKPIAHFDELRASKVWSPEGSEVGYRWLTAIGASPAMLPVTDVMVGLQVSVFDVVPASPIDALLMQWHTRISHVTDLPLSYSLYFLAIDARTFAGIPAADQAVVRDTFEALFREFDQWGVTNNIQALDAMLQRGVQLVPPDEYLFEDLHDRLRHEYQNMAEAGVFSREHFEQLLGKISHYRTARR